MIHLLFKFKDKNNKIICKYEAEYENSKIVFSDSYMERIFEKYKGLKESAESWEIFINCSMATIIVDHYTIKDTFYLASFYDMNSSISVIKARNVKLHIVDIDIKHLETEKCEMFLANSNVEELFCDIRFFKKCKDENNVLSNYRGKFDLRSCNIEKAIFYQNISYLTISESVINNMSFHFIGKKAIRIKGLYIHNTKIKAFNCNFHVKRLTVSDSDIDKVNFMSTSKVELIKVKKSRIENVFGCDDKTIEAKNLEGWYLIKKSNYKVNTNLYCYAGYQICRLENKAKLKMEKSQIKRIGIRCSDLFLRWSIGYAYKPANAVCFSLASIFIFAFIYSCIDWLHLLAQNNEVFNDKYIFNNLMIFIENFYWSGISFTTIGFGEFGAQDWLSRFLAIIEGSLGISTLSLLVIALGKKYLD